MRALSVNQPYARQLIEGSKDREFRNWRPRYSGRLFIHATQDKSKRGVVLDGLRSRGAFIGMVRLGSCVRNEDVQWPYKNAWLVSSPIALLEPVMALGKQGLWKPEPDLLSACVAQLPIRALGRTVRALGVVIDAARGGSNRSVAYVCRDLYSARDACATAADIARQEGIPFGLSTDLVIDFGRGSRLYCVGAGDNQKLRGRERVDVDHSVWSLPGCGLGSELAAIADRAKAWR